MGESRVPATRTRPMAHRKLTISTSRPLVSTIIIPAIPVDLPLTARPSFLPLILSHLRHPMMTALADIPPTTVTATVIQATSLLQPILAVRPRHSLIPLHPAAQMDTGMEMEAGTGMGAATI